MSVRAASVAVLGVALLALACSGPTIADRTILTSERDAPSFAQFADGHVGDFLLRRCGTLDCHGRPERPLRLFGENGLRAPVPAGTPLTKLADPTTDAEKRANWSAVVGLEPERMRAVILAHGLGDCPLEGEGDGDDAPNPHAAAVGDACVRRLLLVSKPLACNQTESHGCDADPLGVEHKGGPVLAPGDDGYVCLVSWLRGAVAADRCQAAAKAGIYQ